MGQKSRAWEKEKRRQACGWDYGAVTIKTGLQGSFLPGQLPNNPTWQPVPVTAPTDSKGGGPAAPSAVTWLRRCLRGCQSCTSLPPNMQISMSHTLRDQQFSGSQQAGWRPPRGATAGIQPCLTPPAAAQS